MTTVKVATWNINSIRLRVGQLIDLIKTGKADVVLLQEIKCQDKDFPFSALQDAGLNFKFVGQKSNNGVAIVSKFPIDVELEFLPLLVEEDDVEARYIEGLCYIDKKVIRVASIYVPMGDSIRPDYISLENSDRFKYKLNFYKRMYDRLLKLKEYENDEYIIFGGDFNVARSDIDLHNPKAAAGGVGFHPLEKAEIERMIALDFIDAHRHINPSDRAYTWWDYRTNAFSRDTGWRLDYLLLSKLAADNLVSCRVDLETRALEKPSDHAPVICEIRL